MCGVVLVATGVWPRGPSDAARHWADRIVALQHCPCEVPVHKYGMTGVAFDQ